LDNKFKEHLGTVDLARLLEETRVHADGARSAVVLIPHLADCDSCREQFEELASLDRQLKSLRPPQSQLRESACPDPGVWREIASSPTPAAQTLTCIEHASRCDHCGPLLREAVADLIGLHGEITGAERNYVATLESSRVEWQQKLAQRISGTLSSAPGRKATTARSWWQTSWVPRLAMVGVSLLAVVGMGSWVIMQRRSQPAAAELLARAYSQKRTIELRIGDARYAPLRVSRGPAASFTSRSPALLKAEALIASQLDAHPSDPAWLQSQAQADLLEGKYDAAVEALRHALELEPHSPAILTDLATAYFQRAQQEDRKEDFGAAYEYLSQALRQRPDDRVALFNRAIIAEHQFLYQQALDDWEHYLRLDPGSQWVEEARNRAAAVREKLKEHSSKALPLLSPAEVAALATSSSPDSAAQRSDVDQRIEEYLHEAVRSWLPQAFGLKSNDDKGAAPALFFLADLTARQHGDLWLTDLLHGSSAPNFPQAANALARALQANDAGNHDVSRQQAALAEQLFRASGNTAGALRAKFERAFSDQLSRHSEECRQEATAALQESARRSYAWVQIQFGLEESVCSGLMGDLGAYEKEAHRAQDRAEKAGYGALYLRALGFVAECKFNTGDRADGWKLLSTGLERFWSAQYPSRRGYNLYTESAYDAEASGRPNLQMASWRGAKDLIDHDESPLLRAWVSTAMANAAIEAHLPQVAERQYADAARLFAAAPNTASRNAELEIEVRASQLEAHQGQFDNAIARLTAIQDQIRPLSNNYLVQMFYSTLGELQLGRHRELEAEQALRPALALAEQSLATLKSEADRSSWSKNAAPAYLALVEAELAQGRSEEALETYEWYLGAPQRMAADSRANRGMTDGATREPSRLASRFPLLTRETVLAYAVLPDGLAIWVCDNRGINAHWIAKSTDGLQELAGRFHDLSSDPKSDLSALRRDARSLYESLITPLEQQLAPGRTLVIEAGGWLAAVPFEALIDADGHYLIERAPMVYSNGQDSQASLHNDTGISADVPALVVGSTASSSADELIPLPGVAAEADAVASGFRSVRVLKGDEATLSAVQSQLPGAAVFHFAGHSLAAPAGSGLMLKGPEGKAKAPRLMGAAAVPRLRLQSLQLAVLSACSTASGDGGSGGFESITDAFLRAGVPHVVASRWAVEETRGFVEDFYRNVLSGQTVSEAVRIASRNMLANPRTSHPYFWSAFAAYGRP
jgi:CHAT domain-containing protein/cytochrome c-type biogenesis protein CcmH/NrfG